MFGSKSCCIKWCAVSTYSNFVLNKHYYFHVVNDNNEINTCNDDFVVVGVVSFIFFPQKYNRYNKFNKLTHQV